MNPYELTFIISPLMEEAEAAAITGQIKSSIEKMGGQIKKELTENKKKLAYPVNKQLLGFYGSIEMALESEKIDELRQSLRLNKEISRFLITDSAKKETAAKEAAQRKRLPKKAPVAAGTVLTEPATTEKIKIEEIDKKLEELLKE